MDTSKILLHMERLNGKVLLARNSENMVGLEGDDVSIEVDALAEEQENAKANYQHLNKEHNQIQAQLPYPNVKPYDTTWLPGDLQDLQYKKKQNQPYWAKMRTVRDYLDTGDLYSGHIRFNSGGDRYFMEAPGLATKEWNEGSHKVVLIHVDDKNYKAEVDAWHYPDKNASIDFSRNITMQDRTVQSVDIVLDRSDSMYANITDNYLRNALKRNKSKLGFQSIIQTIQKSRMILDPCHAANLLLFRVAQDPVRQWFCYTGLDIWSTTKTSTAKTIFSLSLAQGLKSTSRIL